MVFYIFIFLICCFALYFSAQWLVGGLLRIAKFLSWREFVVAFFIMASATSVPNLFVGISSVLHKIPELSFAEVLGGNVVDLTLAVALAALIAKGLPAESKLVQTSSLFTIAIAFLPLLLILDGTLGRGDGLVLLLAFVFYLYWLFSKQERFRKVYDGEKKPDFKTFLWDVSKVIVGISILLLAAEGVVRSASFFVESLNVSLALIGILLVGLGNASPEIYFAIAAAKKKENLLILGNLMGAVIVPTTLVLGIVALLSPIKIVDFSPFTIARFFLIISALFFLLFLRGGRKITTKEALFLLGLYFAFVFLEILTK